MMVNDFSKSARGQTLRRQANAVLFQIIVIVGLIIGGISVLAVKFSHDIHTAAQFFFGKIDSVCGCLGSVTFFTHPWLFSALLLGGLLLLTIGCLAIGMILRLCFRTRKFVRFNLQYQKNNKSDKLSKVSRGLDIAVRVIECESKEPIVFCYGYRQPKICVSSALVARLSENELLAVLAHEKFHMDAREPTKLLIVRIVSLLGWFVPGVKSLAGKYTTFSELAADEAATAGFTNKIFLARALHKIIGWEQKRVRSGRLALSFFSSITTERVCQLTDKSYVPASPWFNKKILASLGGALILFMGANSFLSSRVIQNLRTVHPRPQICDFTETRARTLAPAAVCETKNSFDNCAIVYGKTLPNNAVDLSCG